MLLADGQKPVYNTMSASKLLVQHAQTRTEISAQQFRDRRRLAT